MTPATTTPADEPDGTTSRFVATVPPWLLGCWQRAWIRFADGTVNDTDMVMWLQTPERMVDVRIAAGRPPVDRVDHVEHCSPDQLAALASANASTGFTGNGRCTAQWFTYGHGVNFQPECTFPEPGLLEVSADGTTMIERAPSGAYVEEWHLVPGSREHLSHAHLGGGREWFTAGPIAVLVRDRVTTVQPGQPLRAADLDCEFSVARRTPDGRLRVEHSTLPWREGALLDEPV